MEACLASKFEQTNLRNQLIATGERELIDGHWGSPDLIWGYHYPSQAGENRLGKLLMELRSQLQTASQELSVAEKTVTALYHLDWPMKCLHDGLPDKYKERLQTLAKSCDLACFVCVLQARMICIGLIGLGNRIDAWEHRMRTENVDVNSKGRPCRERMLVELRRASSEFAATFDIQRNTDVASWADLRHQLSKFLLWPESAVDSALGPERPVLPTKVTYTQQRAGVIFNGKEYPLCLNENQAHFVEELLLGHADCQESRGVGEVVPLANGGKPSIFGGRFARQLVGALSDAECTKLIELSEKLGYGLAGSRGFNPFARFAFRCLADAPGVAAALDRRLGALLPTEYPPGSGQRRVGFNQRLRFLKYLPGMHHSGDHTDCAHEDPDVGKSMITVQMYLNDQFQGGRTTFISDRLIPVQPTVGGIVAFDHELYHRGGLVTSGVKYALRMDVMYSYAGDAQMHPAKVSRMQRESYYESAGAVQGSQERPGQPTRRWTARR